MTSLYQAQVTSSGGRNGRVTSSDGVIQLPLALPKGLGGPGGAATNPEQLFAAGYAACFDSALAFVAGKRGFKLSGTSVQATVGIGPRAEGGFALSVRLVISAPGTPRDVAQDLIDQADKVCPYSHALRGNVPVELVLA